MLIINLQRFFISTLNRVRAKRLYLFSELCFFVATVFSILFIKLLPIFGDVYGGNSELSINELTTISTLFLRSVQELPLYINNDFWNFFTNSYLKYPLFIYSALFFFLTTFVSLVFLSYLGLYGVFILNLSSLTIL